MPFRLRKVHESMTDQKIVQAALPVEAQLEMLTHVPAMTMLQAMRLTFRTRHGVVRMNPFPFAIRTPVTEQRVHRSDHVLGSTQGVAAERDGAAYSAHKGARCDLIVSRSIRGYPARGRQRIRRGSSLSSIAALSRSSVCD